MDPEIEALLERRFTAPSGGEDKRATLADAIAAHVRPFDALHLGLTHVRGSVALWEILRRFAGTEPGFTLLGVQLTTPATPLVHAGLARALVTSWAGDSYPTPGPSAVYQRALQGGIEMEHWSILTFTQRLAAAARGLPWATTRSLVGSAMATDNAASFRQIEPGVGMVAALVPDVSVFHAAAADARGNVLMTPPMMENVYGALAARRGAVVTVDRLVSEEVVREHAAFGRIPSSAVLAVVEAPFGGHPGGLFARGIAGARSYGEDYAFWTALRRSGRDPADMDAWIKEWVTGPGSHHAYLERLGRERLDRLEDSARPGTWRADLEAALPGAGLDAEPDAIETAIVAAARALAGRIRRGGYTAMLAGAGMANLSAWLAALELAGAGVRIDLVAEMGLVGYWPTPGEPFLFNQRNFPTCTMLTDIDWALSIVVGGARSRSIGSLGAAQVDRHGNINSTMIPGERFLMGSGGANDVATCATETVVCVVQSPERMPERVAYLTAPGERVQAVVSTLGVYAKDEGELVLTGVHDPDVERGVREARATCGWPLRVAREVTTTAPPSREELRTLRLMDPRGYFRR